MPNNYDRIEKAIEYIQYNFSQQPSLSEIAAHVHLSPAYFQRIFTQWAGISPKKFLQYISLEHAKLVLKQSHENSIADATFYTGLSSTSRLHDLFVTIEGMTPAEYKNGGSALRINYSFQETLFGSVIIASTTKGVCYLAFMDSLREDALRLLKQHFPNAIFVEHSDEFQKNALNLFEGSNNTLSDIKVHLKGTEFQLKVWESLLKIPMGQLSTYGAIATQIGHHQAARAVGTAIGNNPVAFLIPCHRVIQATGHFGGYMWGTTRKTAIIGWEANSCNTSQKISNID